MSDTPATPTTPSMIDQLSQRFPNATLIRMGKDGIPSITVPRSDWVATVRALRDEFKCQRFVDVTATDDPDLEERFEVHCFIGRAYEPVWFHIRTRTAHALPSLVSVYPGANWFEREVYDMFGVHFEGHPNLRRILMADDWETHPLRRDEPLGSIPVDFTVTRDIYGT